ncbi:MAG: hypothetical protein ACK5N4_11105, partial [Parabacteroides gordonii]|uniref:DUF5724 domain-containing protein n=1 Tax=Parabacteroides gordonii TaxID=574930 RepID=UPI003A83BE96
DLKMDDGFDMKQVFPILQEGSFLKKLFGKKQEDVYTILEKLNELVARNAGYEYKTRYGYSVLLGNSFWETEGSNKDMPEIDRYPLADVWRKFYKEEIGDFATLLQIYFFINTSWDDVRESGRPDEVSKYYSPAIRSFYGFDLTDRKSRVGKLNYVNIVNQILTILSREYWDNRYARSVARNIMIGFGRTLDKSNLSRIYEYETYGGRKERYTTFIFRDVRIAFWLTDLFDWDTDEEFVS